MPTTENKTETPKPNLKPITPELRELLMKYFGAEPPEKPISGKEFNSIKDYLDRWRGGLTKEAYEMVKDDKDLVKAAAISKVQKDHRVMDHRAPEIRDTLLKALRMPPGEKSLSIEEFKDVVVFLDRKNGGLRRHAFELFKEDAEVVKAAKQNQAMRQEASSSQDKTKTNEKDTSLEKVKSDTEKAIDSVRSRRSRQSSTGLEPGD